MDTTGKVDSVAQSSNATYTRPKIRQRVVKAPAPLEVPHIEEDAAERKRVLNVLAQRRYRERKRLTRASKQKGKGSQSSGDDPNTHAEATAASSGSSSSGALLQDPCLGDFDLDLDRDWPAVTSDLEPTLLSTMINGMSATASTTMPNSFMPVSTSPQTSDLFAGMGVDTVDPSYLTAVGIGGSASNSLWSYSSSSGSSPQGRGMSASASASRLEGGMADFADSCLLAVSELALLRASVMIADRLGFTTNVWSLTANSPFNEGLNTSPDMVPEAWRPTPSQVVMPHHPVIDFLPWPTVRERILGLFSLPDEARPEQAQGDMAVVNLAYDIEDPAEGVRIWGSDPYDPSSWEVGQVLFQRWWFVFDRDVIAQSNRIRRARGAPPLKMSPPSGPRVQDVS